MKMSLISGPLLALCVSTSLLGCHHQGGHHYPPHMAQGQGLHVSGHGEVLAVPDIGIIVLGVEVQATTSEQATAQLGEAMNRVIAAIKKQGIADKDLRTAQLSLYFDKVYHPKPERVAVEGGGSEGDPEKGPEGFYRATNTVEVTVRDIDRTTQVLNAGTGAGANAVHGVRFEIDDDSKYVSEARAIAMKQAQENASQLAALAGVELGAVIALSESGVSHGPVMRQAMMKEASDSSIPVEKGELTISHHVEVTYLLDEKKR